MPFQAFSLKNDSGVLKGGSTLRQKEPGNLNLHIGDSCLFTKTTCFAHYVYKNKLSLHQVIEMLVLICCNIWQYPKIGAVELAIALYGNLPTDLETSQGIKMQYLATEM